MHATPRPMQRAESRVAPTPPARPVRGAAAASAGRADAARREARLYVRVGAVAAAALPMIAAAEGYSLTWAGMGTALACAALAYVARRALA